MPSLVYTDPGFAGGRTVRRHLYPVLVFRRQITTCRCCFALKCLCWLVRTLLTPRSSSVCAIAWSSPSHVIFTNDYPKAQSATLQDIWCLPPDRPPASWLGFLLLGHTSATTPSLAPPNPDVVAATVSVDGEHMLTPPGSAVVLQVSDSPDKSTESDDGSEEDVGTTPSTPYKPSGHVGSVITVARWLNGSPPCTRAATCSTAPPHCRSTRSKLFTYLLHRQVTFHVRTWNCHGRYRRRK